MPIDQQGRPPFVGGGGAWLIEDGAPVQRSTETANVGQAALETMLVAHMVDAVRIDPGDCGEGPARLEPAMIALMGHSMAATIAPVALALEPRFRGTVLSGAGGRWIEDVVHKLRPLETRLLAETILRYGGRRVYTHDPVLSLWQRAGESDSPVYAPLVIDQRGRGRGVPPRAGAAGHRRQRA